MKRWWADTLFKRLFVLMWASLVGSHVLAFWLVTSLHAPPPGSAMNAAQAPPPVRLPTFPSLPPGGPVPAPQTSPGPGPAPPGEPPGGGDRRGGLSASALWLDYGVRFLVMGVAAWFGARWLSGPVRRLSAASQSLSGAIQRHEAAPVLDEDKGTLEVRQAARVFNTMARQLQEQFASQSLLMAAISHDLRTPLARLRLRLESLRAAAPAPDRRENGRAMLDRAVDDVREMDTMIGSVLEMIRNQHLALQAQRVDVLALAQSLADDWCEQGHAVELAPFDTAHGPAVALAQPQALARVLGNLVSNALRHGQRAALVVERGAGAVRVLVDDDGPGIPEDRLEAVFQPFYRVDASRDRGAGGVGLGLYIARDLMARQHGQLTLANRAPRGLRATVSLPPA